MYGLAYTYGSHLDLDASFGRAAPTVLEIGCGSGEALVDLARRYPGKNFVGVDWFRSGIATCLTELNAQEMTNVRLVRADAAGLLEMGLADAPLLDEVKIFFPDPWYGSPFRRIVRPDVMRQISRRMRPSGLLHVATDVEGYPEHVREVVLDPAAAGAHWRVITDAPSPDPTRPSTRYEREGIAAGRRIEDLHFAFDREL